MWLPVGLGDFDFDGDVAADVAPRLAPGGMEPAALPGCVPLADELTRCPADDEWAVGDTVVLLPMLDDVLLLLDSSTATIAMIPIAAAPIPA